VKRSRRLIALMVGVSVAAIAVTGLVSAGSAAPQQSKVKVTLVSDIGRFNDKSFNQLQLEGALKAKKDLGITLVPRQSNSVSDYIPNLTTGVRNGSQLVMAAGFLLAPATATIAKKFPKTEFSIMDYGVTTPPFTKNKNVTGLVFPTEQAGCLVGYMSGLMMKTKWANKPQVIGAVGGIKIPSVDNWIAGYQYCAKLANKKLNVLIGYSQDFVAADKCKTVAEDQIAQGAQILFQVAGGCGLGTLKAADDAKIWGIGVDKDQYNDAKRVMTSGVKRVDTATYLAIKAVVDGKPLGGKNLVFTLKNNGQALGRTNPVVPKSVRAQVAKIQARIIAGKLKPPARLKG
jgi:basic membrane protein A